MSENADYATCRWPVGSNVRRHLADDSWKSPSAPPFMPAFWAYSMSKELGCVERRATSLRRRKVKPDLEGAQSTSDTPYRHSQYAPGMEANVRVTLRVPAHQMLEEREHFGGTYSTREIERKIAPGTGSKTPPLQRRKRIAQ